MPIAVRQQPTVKGTTGSNFVAGIAEISKPTTGIKMAIYGRSGTGKTTIFSTFPKPSLLIKAEEGTRSIYKEKGVFVTPLVTHPEQLVQTCESIRKGKGGYKTVGLDTATAFQDTVLQSIVQRKLPEQMGFAEVGKDEWGQCALKMKECLRCLMDLADLGINIVVLAQERDFSEDNTSDMLLPTVASRVTPSVVDWLNPEVDYIGHTFLKQVTIKKATKKGKESVIRSEEVIKYCLLTGPHPVYVTKFRIPRGNKLPEYLMDPDYTQIAALID